MIGEGVTAKLGVERPPPAIKKDELLDGYGEYAKSLIGIERV
jgi:hypothetical protein